MKLGTVALIAMIAVISPAFAQGWEWQNPRITGNQLTDIGSLNATTGWATSSGGEFLWTTDGGAQWVVRSRSSHYFYKTVFTDENNGWSVSWMGHRVLHTTNGGFTWTEQGDYPDARLMDVTFLDNNHGWVVGYRYQPSYAGMILRTEDGGAHWAEQTFDSVSELNQVCFINLQEGWAGQVWDLLHTTDGGETWAQVPVQFPGYYGLRFLDSNHGWTVGFSDAFHTTDGGRNWTSQGFNFDFDHRPMDIACANDSTVWFVGEGGEVWATFDRGEHWNSQPSNAHSSLQGVYFTDALTGWAAGDGGTVIHTVDGGQHWAFQAGNPATSDLYLTDVEFADLNHGWAIGGSKILHTENGGGAWTVVDSAYGASSVTAIDATSAWVTVSEGGLLHTTNGGTDWNRIQVTGSSWVGNVVHVDSQHLWTFGSPSAVYRSTDGGVTWSGHSIGDYYYSLDMSFVDSANGWIAGGNDEMGAFIVHTTDGGQTWTQQFFDLYGGALTGISFVDPLHGWAACWMGPLMRTTDGGSHWDTVATPQQELGGVQFLDTLNGWVFSDYEQTSRTTDGGLTWQAVQTGCDNRLEAIYFADPENGWVAGWGGSILRHTGVAGTAPKLTSVPVHSFALTAYPNPFNPNTVLSFDIPVRSRIQLFVYDLTGRLVQMLADETFAEGNYQIEFDGSRLPSGIYFARLQGNSFSKTQKLVLLK